MKKIFSLIKATMTENMNLFKIKGKGKKNKILLPIILYALIFFCIYTYADVIMELLDEVNKSYVGLSIFVFIMILFTLIEGIFKSSGILFNCKDDDLLFSLPLKKQTILFVRIFKLYVFELLYSSIFIIPPMIAYIKYGNINITYFIILILSIFILPIIPIALSCIIGMFISSVSSKFKKKNIIQIIVTIIVLLFVLFTSYSLNSLMDIVVDNAYNINDIINKVYYINRLYINLILDFNIKDLLLFIFSPIIIFGLVILLLSLVYFKINSRLKKVETNNKKYKIKVNSIKVSLIKKELNRYISSTVYVTNTMLGLILFIIISLLISFNFEGIASGFVDSLDLSINQIKMYIPLILFGLVILTSFTTSITSSSISIERKSFYILKTIPVSAYDIIKYKIISSLLIMIPFILIGDLIVIFNFNFSFIELIIILFESFILPLISQMLGIIINLKHPNIKASNDVEIVKQSKSSLISVLFGILLVIFNLFLVEIFVSLKMPIDVIMSILLLIYSFVFLILFIDLKKNGVRKFNEIVV